MREIGFLSIVLTKSSHQSHTLHKPPPEFLCFFQNSELACSCIRNLDDNPHNLLNNLFRNGPMSFCISFKFSSRPRKINVNEITLRVTSSEGFY